MTQDMQMARATMAAGPAGALPMQMAPADEWAQPPVGGAAGGMGGGADPLKRLQRLLRGRYLLAVVLAVSGAAIGGALGFIIPKPYYTSTGVVRIDPMVHSPLERDQQMPLYNQYVASQVQIIHSSRVVGQAMNSNEWRALKKSYPAGLDPAAEFANNLDVEASRDSSLVSVTFADLDPNVAAVGVKAVLNAYQELYAEMESDEGRRKLIELEKRQTQLRNRSDMAQEELRNLSKDFGTDDLAPLHSAKQTELTRREADYETYQQELAMIEKLMAGSENGISSLTDMDIARVDGTMAQLLQRQQASLLNIETLKARLGDKHREVQDAINQLNMVNAQVKKYGDEFRKEYVVLIPGFANEPSKLLTKKDIDVLRDRCTTAKSAFERVQLETQKVAEQRYKLDSKKADLDKIKADLDMVNRRVEAENAKASVAAQVSVLDTGSVATTPSIDRRKQMAILGVLGGGAFPVALLVLIGLIDSRYRYSDDANATLSGIPLLGILPNLPDLLTDPEQAAMAAHCVHQIRTMLQISADSQDRRVFCVSSPSPGDGKTSLTLALGLSFATAGSKTLLIDLDLVGAGLTSRMNVLTPEGVLDAINNRSILPYVQSTDITDLSILPVGRASARHASMLSPAVVRKLVTEARNHFDTVLIDTGPILGSIEASPVCVCADAVILAVARGQQRPLVEKALNHLMSIGARLAGVVFNRAQARDFEQSVSRISMRSLRAPGAAPTNGNGHDARPQERRPPQLGPVARAVAKSVHSGPANGDNHG